MPDEREIAQAVDQVLDPVLGREVRRARNIRLKGGFARLGVLLNPVVAHLREKSCRPPAAVLLLRHRDALHLRTRGPDLRADQPDTKPGELIAGPRAVGCFRRLHRGGPDRRRISSGPEPLVPQNAGPVMVAVLAATARGPRGAGSNRCARSQLQFHMRPVDRLPSLVRSSIECSRLRWQGQTTDQQPPWLRGQHGQTIVRRRRAACSGRKHRRGIRRRGR